MKLRLGCLVGLLGMLASSCGGGGSPTYSTMGMLGSPSLAVILSNLVFVDGSINGSEGNAVLIDSGSPVVLVANDPGVFPGLTLPDTQQVTINFSLLSSSGIPVVTIDNIPAFQLSMAMMDSIPFPGILGGNVLRQFSVQLDYAAPMMNGFCLGCASGPRSDVESPGGAVPFTLKGGGKSRVDFSASMPSDVVTIPPTRIPLTVTIEGTAHPFMLDTGASEVSVRTTVYQALVADQRAQLAGGFAVQTVNGSATAAVTRAKTITLGSETVLDAPVMSIPGDDLLDGISTELGYTLDGLLGGSFLRNFLVTIDYPHGQLHLQRYTNPPVADEFRRAGLVLGLDDKGTSFVVTYVYPGSDAAAKQIMNNDQVVAVDQVPLNTMTDVVAADNLLDGTPGTTKAITFGATTADAALAGTTVNVLVNDLIPNP